MYKTHITDLYEQKQQMRTVSRSRLVHSLLQYFAYALLK